VSAAETGVVVVGGGTGALGRAVVRRMVGDGHRVLVPAREEHVEGLPAEVAVVRCDLSVPQDVAAVDARARELGGWRALVNCSGGYAAATALDTSEELLHAQLELNLLGPWRLATAAARAMVEAGEGGRIVTVASRAAVEPARGQAAYQVSKAAVARLTQVMALELRDTGITVNAVMPSTMDTPANRASMPKADWSRWVSVDDVAATIAWLLSPEASIVSGALVPVYGRA